uniref:Uncharacterized protein n=1 Tax=Pinguiococcus pyrenoidosus TaxID=172671 RepID=A0A7R9YCV8_9STRA
MLQFVPTRLRGVAKASPAAAGVLGKRAGVGGAQEEPEREGGVGKRPRVTAASPTLGPGSGAQEKRLRTAYAPVSGPSLGRLARPRLGMGLSVPRPAGARLLPAAQIALARAAAQEEEDRKASEDRADRADRDSAEEAAAAGPREATEEETLDNFFAEINSLPVEEAGDDG